jgi:hypothetical protein
MSLNKKDKEEINSNTHSFLNTIVLRIEGKPMLVLDSDSVLLDWCKGFTSFLKEQGICTAHVEHLMGTTTFIPTPEITKILCKQANKDLMAQFNETDWLTKLPVFQQEAVVHLQDLAKHYNIVVLTCIGETDDIIEKRTQNLIDIYGDIFSGIICINYGTSKELYLEELHKTYGVTTFVDDRLNHINESISAGVTPILFERGVSEPIEKNEEFHVMSCWSQIHKHLTKDLS